MHSVQQKKGGIPPAIRQLSQLSSASSFDVWIHGIVNPKLDTRISVRSFICSFVRSSFTLVLPPLDSKTGWTEELWSNRVLLILEN